VYVLAHRAARFDLRRAALRVLASIEIEGSPHFRVYHSRVGPPQRAVRSSPSTPARPRPDGNFIFAITHPR
jgi:hypothetical protein